MNSRKKPDYTGLIPENLLPIEPQFGKGHGKFMIYATPSQDPYDSMAPNVPNTYVPGKPMNAFAAPPREERKLNLNNRVKVIRPKKSYFFENIPTLIPYASENDNEVLITSTVKNLLKQNKHVFLCIVAHWCGHCTATAPELEPIINKYKNKVEFIKLDFTDNEQDTARKRTALTNAVMKAFPDAFKDGFGFPTFIFVTGKGDRIKYEVYEDDRKKEDFDDYFRSKG